MSVAWSEGLATGVAEIDAQHRELLRQLGRLLDVMRHDPVAVGRLLDFLGDFAVSHFAAEERLMERHAYPEAARHREAHEGFLRAFGRIRRDYDLEGLSDGMAELIQGWMIDWLRGHIVDLDRLLGRWLAGRPEADGAAGQEAADGPGTWVVPAGPALRVLSVSRGRALERAGVEPGDLILAIGGRRVAELGVEQAVASLSAPGAGGLTLTVHPGGDRERIATRFLPRRAVAPPAPVH